MPGIDFIVGLLDKIRGYMELLTLMLCSQREDVASSAENVSEVRLWTDGVVEEAPEDMETSLPCVFGPVLSFIKVL